MVNKRILTAVWKAFGFAIDIALLSAVVILIVAVVRHRHTGGTSPSALTPLPGWLDATKSGHRIGAEGAPILVVEFGDFACKLCAQKHNDLMRLRSEFPDHLAVLFKMLPTTAGYPLALAAECASHVGRFDDFAAAAYRTTSAGAHVPEWKDIVATSGIGHLDRITQCIDSAGVKADIVASVRDANRLGVKGSPSILVNGVLLKGDLSYEILRSHVISALDAGDPRRPGYRDRWAIRSTEGRRDGRLE